MAKEELNTQDIPKHLAIIMDGNGRWAKKHGKESRLEGHQNAVAAVQAAVEGCGEIGIEYLTLFAFSTENWNRPKAEVEGLMELLVNTIRKETEELNKNEIRMNAIGDLDLLPGNCKKELQEVMEITKNNKKLTLTLALSYSGKWDIMQAVRKVIKDTKNGKFADKDISEAEFSDYLSTYKIPDPELMIRTSGEFRISNFLLWQLAYTEIVILDTLWPDFRKEHLYASVKDYQSRERRFGLTSEQITSK